MLSLDQGGVLRKSFNTIPAMTAAPFPRLPAPRVANRAEYLAAFVASLSDVAAVLLE